MARQLQAIEADESLLDPPSSTHDVSSQAPGALVRRGMAWGAFAGFVFGLMPLIASTGFGAMAGAIIAKLSHVKVDRGSAPRIYFSG